MRHLELCRALEDAGLTVRRGEKVPGGFVWFSVGGERHRLQWVAPGTGDADLDYLTTTDGAAGLGWTLRSIKWALLYIDGPFYAWEASQGERVEDLEKTEKKEAPTSERACDAKRNAGVCTPRNSNPGGRGIAGT